MLPEIILMDLRVKYLEIANQDMEKKNVNTINAQGLLIHFVLNLYID